MTPQEQQMLPPEDYSGEQGYTPDPGLDQSGSPAATTVAAPGGKLTAAMGLQQKLAQQQQQMQAYAAEWAAQDAQAAAVAPAAAPNAAAAALAAKQKRLSMVARKKAEGLARYGQSRWTGQDRGPREARGPHDPNAPRRGNGPSAAEMAKGAPGLPGMATAPGLAAAPGMAQPTPVQPMSPVQTMRQMDEQNLQQSRTQGNVFQQPFVAPAPPPPLVQGAATPYRQPKLGSKVGG